MNKIEIPIVARTEPGSGDLEEVMTAAVDAHVECSCGRCEEAAAVALAAKIHGLPLEIDERWVVYVRLADLPQLQREAGARSQ